MIIIKQFENKNILLVDTVSLKAKLGIKNLGYFANEAGLPGVATNGDYAIIGSTDTVWVWDSDTNTWKNTGTTSTGDMLKSDNLSGLANYATARQNLGLNTTANQTDYTNKRFMSDAQEIKLDGISGTNTGDNAVNSLYSGLATSKQNTLVSGTNIKTVNGTSLLGSGNIVISGGSGAIKRILTVGGTIGTTGVNVGPDLTIDGTYTISKVNMWYGTAGNGTLIVDINKNGTTLFATTNPSITGTNKYSINTGTLTTTSLISGDVLTIDIDSISGTPGTDLYVEIIYS